MASAPNVDLLDTYFRRADLDRNGRISGAEAVGFFQGSDLHKQVLAQVTLSLSFSMCV
jgi:epidermal growth factor receptor substrate 15